MRLIWCFCHAANVVIVQTSDATTLVVSLAIMLGILNDQLVKVFFRLVILLV